MVGINDAEKQVSFTARDFTLQEVTITLQGNVDETSVYFNITSNYTITDVRTKSAVKEQAMKRCQQL
jgi:outer membrane lipoprotein-sorting protein